MSDQPGRLIDTEVQRFYCSICNVSGPGSTGVSTAWLGNGSSESASASTGPPRTIRAWLDRSLHLSLSRFVGEQRLGNPLYRPLGNGPDGLVGHTVRVSEFPEAFARPGALHDLWPQFRRDDRVRYISRPVDHSKQDGNSGMRDRSPSGWHAQP